MGENTDEVNRVKGPSLKRSAAGFSHGLAKTQNFKSVSEEHVIKNSNMFQPGHELTASKTPNASDMTCAIILSHMSLLQFQGFPPKNDYKYSKLT